MNNYHFEEKSILSKTGKPIVFDFAFKKTNTQKPLVIFAHGFKGFKDWGHFKQISDYMIERDVVFLKFNFSFNGTTPSFPQDFVDLEAFGNNNFSKELNDIDSLLDILTSSNSPIQNTEVDTNNIILIGHSKGGATTIIKSNEDTRIKKAITWASVLDIKSRYASNLENWKEQGVQLIYNGRTNQNMPLYYQLAEDVLNNEEKFNIPSILKKISKPLLVIHAKNDDVITLEELQIAINANNPFVRVAITKGNHTFDGHHPYCTCSLPESTIRACHKSLNFIFE